MAEKILTPFSTSILDQVFTPHLKATQGLLQHNPHSISRDHCTIGPNKRAFFARSPPAWGDFAPTKLTGDQDHSYNAHMLYVTPTLLCSSFLLLYKGLPFGGGPQ